MAVHKKNNIISDNSDKPKSKESTHYVNKEEFYNEFVIWYAARKLAEDCGDDEPPIPEEIGRNILLIASHTAKKHNWQSNSHYRQEMISDAVLNCIKYIRNFDVEKSKNPFSYFTQISYYSFLKTIDIEKTQDYVKHKSTLNSQIFQELQNGTLDDEDKVLEDFEYNLESVEDFISIYENRAFGKKLNIDTVAGSGGKNKKIPTKDDEYGFF